MQHNDMRVCTLEGVNKDKTNFILKDIHTGEKIAQYSPNPDHNVVRLLKIALATQDRKSFVVRWAEGDTDMKIVDANYFSIYKEILI